MRKAIISMLVILMGVFLILSGCAKKEEAAASTWKDGVYFAQLPDFDPETGWKDVVILEVKDGKIASVVWNAVHRDAGPDKITRSMNGQYPMVERGGAKVPWHEQAQKAVAYLLETQDPTKITYKDDEGHTDAISGVSIHVKELFELAKEALERGPVGYGPYKDGTYHAEQADFSPQGWKEFVDITVLGGRIVAVRWDALHKDGGDPKDTRSRNGEYGMYENGGAQAPWWQQAEAVEKYLMQTQDPTKITYKDDEGHTDAISGVSIHVNSFFQLAQEALKDARR
ncbi:hypothetical protein Spith_2030 [Spirochaeta thermophila DSM 6578]|uniref:FMN-binding domain protein n=1 Tax=Winmispira thermophila (strain ATCC 700085 / DSM 6578 / Z-1203) TaxID=869211 RepID=G0GEF0_WINT7|nr:hypothetical protein [Spirochaeta thermophila]AEJ62287.1 hypothetical protein Spith_2030 [Spirochaeta thermophila DSM 6578]